MQQGELVEGTNVHLHAFVVDYEVAFGVGFDCACEVEFRCEVELDGVSCWIEDADVVAVVVGVFGEFAGFVVDSRGGAVEEVFGFGALGGGVEAGVGLEGEGGGEGYAVGCCWWVLVGGGSWGGFLGGGLDAPRIGGKSLDGAVVILISGARPLGAESRFLFLSDMAAVVVVVLNSVGGFGGGFGEVWAQKKKLDPVHAAEPHPGNLAQPEQYRCTTPKCLLAHCFIGCPLEGFISRPITILLPLLCLLVLFQMYPCGRFVSTKKSRLSRQPQTSKCKAGITTLHKIVE